MGNGRQLRICPKITTVVHDTRGEVLQEIGLISMEKYTGKLQIGSVGDSTSPESMNRNPIG